MCSDSRAGSRKVLHTVYRTFVADHLRHRLVGPLCHIIYLPQRTSTYPSATSPYNICGSNLQLLTDACHSGWNDMWLVQTTFVSNRQHLCTSICSTFTAENENTHDTCMHLCEWIQLATMYDRARSRQHTSMEACMLPSSAMVSNCVMKPFSTYRMPLALFQHSASSVYLR